MIELRGISKAYPGVKSLDRVDFAASAGEVHALLGENGAVKSTLMRVLGGEMIPSQGEIVIDGKSVVFLDPRDARALGIVVIHQELALAPDLTVEVLSVSNTGAEMKKKREDYFAVGVRLAWEVDPDTRTVNVYTSPDQVTVLHASDTLDGGAVLPGFTLPLRDLFAELDRQG